VARYPRRICEKPRHLSPGGAWFILDVARAKEAGWVSFPERRGPESLSPAAILVLLARIMAG